VKDTAMTCKSLIKRSRLFVNDYQPITVDAKKCFVNMEIALTHRFALQLSLIHNLIYVVDEEKLREETASVTTVSVLTSIPAHSPRILHITYLQ
jgi:hypothetical protein